MRLIFDNEIKFLNKELGIEIPTRSAFMDRMIVKVVDENGNFINIYRIKAKDMKLELTKNNKDVLDSVKIKTWDDLIQERKEHLLNLENAAIKIITEYIDKYNSYIPSIPVSGGKDSAVTHYLVNKATNKENEIIFSNTSNETHHTYKYIKKNYPTARIISPKIGFYNLVKQYGTIPSRFNRYCCTIEKELPMIEQLDRNEKRLFFMGMRKAESQKRSSYTVEWKNTRWGDRDWLGILPVLEWQDLDILFYMMFRNIPFNDIYTFGQNRVGCTNCPYRSDYELILNKEFLKPYHDRWQNILEDDFIIHKKSPALNCTLQEYKNGAWKAGLVRLEATPEIIEEFAEQQGLSYELAEKYFNKTCSSCDKKLKKNDIALNLKFISRKLEDFQCTKCLAETLGYTNKQMKDKAKELKTQGCELF